jgi:dienelactone hydrolase
MLSLLAALTFSPAALALPSREIHEALKNSFVPGFTATETRDGYSLSLCPISNLELAIYDPITKKPATVQAQIYRPSLGRAADRSVILIPPTGGENMLDRGYANSLCSAGIQVVLLQGWSHQLDVRLDLAIHDEGAHRALSAIRHTLDYLNPSRNSQVGILGTSVGALGAALALGFEPRLQSAALIVGGVGLPEIYAATTEEGASKLREARTKAFGYKSQAEYLADLRANVKIDPRDFVGVSGPKNLITFTGLKDLTVPTANQKELAQLFDAENHDFAGDHLRTILNTFFWERDRIVEFFDKNLR